MSIAGFLYLICVAVFIFFPSSTSALGAAANAMCNPWNIACPCGAGINPPKCDSGGPNKANCPVGICVDTTNGFTTLGVCPAANKCEGVTASGKGGDLKGAQEALGMLKQIADLFKGGGGGGGGGGSTPTDTYTGTGATGCTQTYFVTQPSTDPCAIYNPDPLSSGLGGVSDSLLDALKGTDTTGGTVIKVTTSTSTGTTNSTATTPTNTATTTVSVTPINAPGSASSTGLRPDGFSGDVQELSAGATIIGNFREGLSEVAGFFGAGTLGGGASKSAAGRLCENRPWAQGLLSNVIPTSFFDGLCRWSGYQVGMAQQAQVQAQSGTSFIPGAGSAKVQNTTPAQAQYAPIQGEADIWAEPVNVRLGARTYIFWNSRNVVSCRSEGPSFLQTSLSGGAATVPIAGPTTFTIECQTAASTTVRDSVTVQIAI